MNVRSPFFYFFLSITADLTLASDMLTSNQPPLTQHISTPRDLSQLSCEAYTAGLIEGVLDGLEIVRIPFLSYPSSDPRLI